MRIAFYYHKLKNSIAVGTVLGVLCMGLAACNCHCNNGGWTDNERRVDKYLNRVRNNTALLTSFFNGMPKGGDLHNHLTGSVYAETYVDYVIDRDYWINTNTLEVAEKKGEGKDWVTFTMLRKAGTLAQYEEKLMQKWSVKDYNHVSYPCDLQFFETFPAFNIATKGDGRTDTFIMELKHRAINEHVSYIEVMTSAGGSEVPDPDTAFNSKINQARMHDDTVLLWHLMDSMYNRLTPAVSQYAAAFSSKIKSHHAQMHFDDSNFTMRYLVCAVRVAPPALVFKNLMIDFMCAADTTSPIVGVNILAPENNDVAMRDYWVHMQMFKYLHHKKDLQHVKYSMHAGELALGMVKPEDMSWHINDAVYTAEAQRIGHGVDMAYEHNNDSLLRYMAEHQIAEEVNLSSNEFILQVTGSKHPISLYRKYRVPIVISTDDPGVLRTNMIWQYVLLASRYRYVSYKDIKEYVYNSIDYSFIREPEVRKALHAKLDRDFTTFERSVLGNHAMGDHKR